MTQGQANDPLLGVTIADKYRISHLLGEGGMGCVYLGEQRLGNTVRKVAVKTLHRHLSHDPNIKKRFTRECETVAALEHPNTIQVHDYGEMPDGTLYIVMEYVKGQSVADILEKEGPMPPARVDNIMRQVCGSLEEAHGHGIVHRDLKPDNVVLCERAGQKDWVEVLDFGIAKRQEDHDPNEAKLTQQGMVLGTPPYMSPEQFTGQPIDSRSDIYSLGVMAYEMLVGKLPFEATTAWEWASKHMTEPPAPMELSRLGANVPEKMRAAIMRALEKDRNIRFANVKEFYAAFSLAGDPNAAVSAPNPSMGRAKTEMAQPAMAPGMMGPPPGMGPNPHFATAPGMPAQPMQYGDPMMKPAAVAPAMAPAPMAPRRSGGGAGLFIALGVVGAVLLVGGGAAALFLMPSSGGHGGDPPPIAVPTSATATTAETATAATAETTADTAAPTNSVAESPPLDPTPTTAPLDPTPTHAPTHPTQQPTTHPPATHPTHPPPPPPPKKDPPICGKARKAKQLGLPASTVASLEAQCVAQGGKP